MKRNRKIFTAAGISPIGAVIIGVTICLVLSLIISVIAAVLVDVEHISFRTVPMITLLTHFIAAFVGCTVSVMLAKHMPLLIGGICSGAYFLILLCANMLFFDGGFEGIGKGIAAIISGGTLAIVLNVLPKSKRSKHRPKKF